LERLTWGHGVHLWLRWAAILALGRFFTVDVAVQSDHRVIQHGPYRYMRHPSYTGALLQVLGLGLGLASWVSLLVMIVPIGSTLAYRIFVEEQALRQSLGQAYDDYCKTTPRLIPFLW
jgi:protein-S-isoprenylcysteine O-methyltransferase